MKRVMPKLLKRLHKLEFDFAEGDGIDFEPYDDFYSPEETQEWIRDWTGNPKADGTPYLIFGQDGTGGYAAIWNVRPGSDLPSQPIVFFGSEGAVGVVAQNLSDYLWLLAGNIGPMEAVEYCSDDRPTNEDFAEFARQHATTPAAKPTEIVARARAEFPGFETQIRALCR
jgi:hypothetical protein